MPFQDGIIDIDNFDNFDNFEYFIYATKSNRYKK